MDTIHSRIKAARVAKVLSMEQLAAEVGVSYQTVQQWENGKTAPKRKRLEKVASTLGTTPEHLLFGTDSDGNPDHAPILLVDAKASAGRGEIIMSQDASKVLMFRRDWLKKNDAKPDRTIAFEVRGDSMIDAHIVDKAVVLANRDRTEPRVGRIYVLWIGDDLYVKELAQVDGAWVARSRNAAKAEKYKDIPIDAQSGIVGRAFWCGFGV